MINILLSGGSGTRLWPLSRTMLPKQFVKLFAGRSLFQEAVMRNQAVCQKIHIVSNIEQYFLALDQLNETSLTDAQFLLEPIGRNTAPAIALAALACDEDDILLVTPSDQLIKNRAAYEQAVGQAKVLAEAGYLVTFGIRPTYAETGFGYIEAQGNNVLSFKEKPDANTAQAYIEQGNYYWNSGMFCFKAGMFLAELQHYAPEIYTASVKALQNANQQHSECRITLADMLAIPDNSIDYAVMEQSDKVKVVPCEMGWSDVGSFDALYDEVKTPELANAIMHRHEQSLEPITLNAKRNLIVTRDRQIALIDVDDLLVVDTADALLISHKGSAQKVKQVVAEIKKTQPELTEVHRLAYRPWGSYEVLINAPQYKVKRIVVKPKGKLSLQKHFHRNEHWIVVSGTATVTVENNTYLVRPNESTYIQMGQIHRLENQGKIDLVMMEVQVGEYTGEDDIVRLEDDYGR